MPKECDHFSQEKEGIPPNTKSCEECEKEHLPVAAFGMCLTCGHVGCCDSSLENMQQSTFKILGIR